MSPLIIVFGSAFIIILGGIGIYNYLRCRRVAQPQYSQEQEQRQLIDALVGASAVLNSSLDVDTVLNRILAYATSVVPHESASIMLIDYTTRRARIVANRGHTGRGLDDWAETFTIPIDDPDFYIYPAIHENRAHVISNLTDDPRRLRVPETHWLLSFACAPLRHEGRVIGILNIDSAIPGFFTQRHADWLQAFADHASIALQNAELYQAAQTRAQELAGMVDELDAFAHTVAHNLKNPLTVLGGYSNNLRENDDTLSLTDRIESLMQIERYSARINNIVDELLLLASVRKMDSVQLVSFDMGPIVADVLERLSVLSAEHGAHIKVPPTWPTVIGYAAWVGEVWTNTISNAIKYGAPATGIAPQIELGATVQPDGMVRCWVRDQGPGIAPDQQTQLFTEFTRLPVIQTSGYGLGLSIVRRIMDKLDGEVGVESVPGEGSTFYFTLPGSA